jgi:large subunit ribosomal protein L37Ae
MAEKEKFGSIKRFGARYGRTVKHNFAKIEKEQRKLHKCPYCNKISVKRVSVGIWFCKKCEAKFTGRAYTIRDIATGKKEMVKDLEEPLGGEE